MPHIVGLPGRVQTFAGTTVGGTKLSETQILYDNAAAYTTAPTKGEATASRVWLDNTGGYVISTAVAEEDGLPPISPLGHMMGHGGHEATVAVGDETVKLVLEWTPKVRHG